MAPSVATLVAAFLSFASLVLVAISMATNYWVRFDDRASEVSSLNPIETNSQLTGLTLEYDLHYFGLWVGCHLERNFDKKSCGYIGSSCYSNICWVRNKEDEVCKDARVKPVNNCSAYQATRAMAIIGTIFLIAGASILVVSIFVTSRNLLSLGALCTFIGGFFLMIAFAVFYDNIFRRLDDIASIGWSFILLIVAWPLAMLAGLSGIISTMLSPKQEAEQEYDGDDDA